MEGSISTYFHYHSSLICIISLQSLKEKEESRVALALENTSEMKPIHQPLVELVKTKLIEKRLKYENIGWFK